MIIILLGTACCSTALLPHADIPITFPHMHNISRHRRHRRSIPRRHLTSRAIDSYVKSILFFRFRPLATTPCPAGRRFFCFSSPRFFESFLRVFGFSYVNIIGVPIARSTAVTAATAFAGPETDARA